MGGAQPLAATMNGAAFLGVEVNPERIERRLQTRYLDRVSRDLDEALAWLREAKEQRRPLSVGLAGNSAAVLPEPGDGFDPDRFVTSAGTLYMVADSVTVEAPVAPLFACLATEVHHAAAQTGQASPAGRLDPPLLMALDEVTQTAAVPLADWLATSAGSGIQVCFIVHTPAQLRARYGKDHADAIWALAGCSRHSVALLRKRLPRAPVPTPEDRRVFTRLMADLDSDNFATRQSAERRLEKLGPVAEPLVRAALEGRLTLEVRRRLEQFISALEDKEKASWTRVFRALEALEHADGPEARQLLADLAAGDPAGRLAREAKAVLGRLRARRQDVSSGEE